MKAGFARTPYRPPTYFRFQESSPCTMFPKTLQKILSAKYPLTLPLSPESEKEGKGERGFSDVGRNHRECSLCFIMQNLF